MYSAISPLERKSLLQRLDLDCSWTEGAIGTIESGQTAEVWALPRRNILVTPARTAPPFSSDDLPLTIRSADRLKKKRIPSNGEEARRQKFSRCGQSSHNRQTCKNLIPLRTSTHGQGSRSSSRFRH
ncbi:hypothetical protein TorRG33x02_242820 [Trema orientale]|uniref:Uncharacterized protein n=1 Tax=Trema orientale TaxID=63057 RepID=A0A2P5DSU0_TREOI|nr:hypothetical protein TorRG33x02_242820 [Trema orientale]